MSILGGYILGTTVNSLFTVNKAEKVAVVIPDDAIQNPPEFWMERLRRGNRVFLVKEGVCATITAPYEAPVGYRLGSIFMKSDASYIDDRWSIDINGNGFDGGRLMLPFKGDLEDEPCPLPGLEFRHMYREFEKLKLENQSLQRSIKRLEDKYLDLHDVHDIIR